jgi:acetyltransferase-like isoleucine patch superfamily enzyme
VKTVASRVRRVVADLLGALVLWVPGRVGSELRVAYYRRRGARIGRGVQLGVGVLIDSPGDVEIGDRSWIDRYAILIAGAPRPGRETRQVGTSGTPGRLVIGRRCHIGPHTVTSALGGVTIGDDVTASAGTKIYSLSHHYRSWSRPADDRVVFGSMGDDDLQSMLQGPVLIDSKVGLGADVLVLPGTHLAERTFVRPRSTVSGDWPPNSILEGTPAQRSGPRFRADPGPAEHG